jgi:hypothetical protein
VKKVRYKMNATLYYRIRNSVRGWSFLYVNPVNVRKILNMGYSRRVFRILYPEYLYTLKIDYYDPHEEYNFTPVFS